MSTFLTKNLAPYAAKGLEGLVQSLSVGAFHSLTEVSGVPPMPPPKLSDATKEKLKTWSVFILCFLVSFAGVWLSFRVFGAKIVAVGKWEAALAIAIVMLGITYGAKFANADARKSFTPVDLIQYLSQGFLWPSTWPALAEFLKVTPIAPPKGATAVQLIRIATGIFGFSNF